MFLGVSALVFVASAALTVVWCQSMSAMNAAAMPGCTMPMEWMRMPGQSWHAAGASFLGMWVAMMVAMMLPSLVPMLGRYRETVGVSGRARLAGLTMLVALGYFFLWTVIGIAVYPLGAALVGITMAQPALARAVPFAVAAVILVAGILQFTPWKKHHLACCRAVPGGDRAMPGRDDTLPATPGAAWRHGLRLGIHCSQCCAGLIAILFVIGVMNLRAMALVATAITIERIAQKGERLAWGIGVVVIAAGVLLIARAARVG